MVIKRDGAHTNHQQVEETQNKTKKTYKQITIPVCMLFCLLLNSNFSVVQAKQIRLPVSFDSPKFSQTNLSSPFSDSFLEPFHSLLPRTIQFNKIFYITPHRTYKFYSCVPTAPQREYVLHYTFMYWLLVLVRLMLLLLLLSMLLDQNVTNFF